MKLMQYLGIFILVLMPLNPTFAQDDAELLSEHFEDEFFGLAFDYPAEWRVQFDQGSQNEFFVWDGDEIPDENGLLGVNIRIEPLARGFSSKNTSLKAAETLAQEEAADEDETEATATPSAEDELRFPYPTALMGWHYIGGGDRLSLLMLSAEEGMDYLLTVEGYFADEKLDIENEIVHGIAASLTYTHPIPERQFYPNYYRSRDRSLIQVEYPNPLSVGIEQPYAVEFATGFTINPNSSLFSGDLYVSIERVAYADLSDEFQAVADDPLALANAIAEDEVFGFGMAGVNEKTLETPFGDNSGRVDDGEWFVWVIPMEDGEHFIKMLGGQGPTDDDIDEIMSNMLATLRFSEPPAKEE